VAWLAILSSSEFLYQLACLLVVNVNHSVFASGDEVVTIGLVVAAKQLIQSIGGNLVQLLARSGVVVRQGSICVGSDHHVFGYSGRIQGTPSTKVKLVILLEACARADFLHVLVQEVALLAGEKIENLDRAVTTASSDVLVVVVESDAESGRRNITESVLV